VVLLCIRFALAIPNDGVYTLRNVNSGLYLQSSSFESVTTGEASDTGPSKWQIRRVEGDFFTLRNLGTERYLSSDPHETLKQAANGDVVALSGIGRPYTWWRLQEVSNGDGTAYTLENAHANLFVSVKWASRSVGATVHFWSSPGKAETQWELSGEGVCHDAEQAELCYHDSMWAKEHGVVEHPAWYPGLSNESSLAEFQAHLHFCFWNRCPLPCTRTMQQTCGIPNRVWSSAGCKDAVSGDRCYSEVIWANEHGIYLYPEWYPDMTEQSSFRQFQAWLVYGQEAGLAWHDCQKPCCHDTRPGELCHDDVSWAQKFGINVPGYKDVYPPVLTNTSNIAEFQAYLHRCYPGRCPEPCASTEMMISKHDLSLDCPDSFNF